MMQLKHPLFLALLFLLPLAPQGQPMLEWQNALGGDVDDVGHCVRPTADGGYIVSGAANSNSGDLTDNEGEADYWIIKLDSSGTKEWQKNYGGSLNDDAYAVDQTLDGGYILAGTAASDDTDVTCTMNGSQDYWVLKLDASGNEEWQSCFGGSGSDHLNAIVQMPDSGFVAAGFTYSSDGDVSANNGAPDAWLVRMDKNGNLVWENNYGGSDYDKANMMTRAYDNGLLVIGSSMSSDIDVSSNNGGLDYWVMKVGSGGTLQWENNFGGSNHDYGNDLIELPDSSLYITGSVSSDDGDVTGYRGGNYDAWTVHLDSLGSLKWQQALGGSGDDRAYALTRTPDNGAFVAATSKSSDGDASTNKGNFDYWMTKIDTGGNLVWERTFGGSEEEYAYFASMTRDSGIVVTGGSRSTNGDVSGQHGSWGGMDVWTVKFASLSSSSLLHWRGTTSNDWHTGTNWEPNRIPTSSDNVIIDSVNNHPIINGNNGVAENMYMEPGSRITITSGDTLRLSGVLTMGADSASISSLIDHGQLTATKAVKKELLLNGENTAYVSSPVPEEEAGVFAYAQLQRWSEPDTAWIAMDASDTLKTLNGYDAEYTDSTFHTIVYEEDSFHTGPYSISVTNSNNGDPSLDGFNLLGNPYPSAVDWESGAITRNNIDPTIYYWDGSQYATYNASTGASTNGGTRYIPPMQGFMVKCNNTSGGTFGVNNNARVHNDQAYWRGGAKDLNHALGMEVSGNSYKDEHVIHFRSGSTEDFENTRDVYKLQGIQSAPQLHSMAQGKTNVKTAINTLPELDSDTAIQLGLKIPSSGVYEMTATDMDNFEDSLGLYLEDTQTGTMTDLRTDTTYSFNADPSDDTYRLHLHFTIDGTNPLPIELLDFKATPKEAAVQLDWSTAAEKNNDHFLLQRSSAGKTFQTFQKVPGKGTTNQQTTYQATDPDPVKGTSYYRLIQVDRNGTQTPSGIEAVTFETASEASVEVAPNPSQEQRFSLSVTGWEPKESINIRIRDLKGRLYFSTKAQTSPQGSFENTFELPSTLPAGTYTIIVHQGNKRVMRKLVH